MRGYQRQWRLKNLRSKWGLNIFLKCLDNFFFFIHNLYLIAIWESIEIYAAIVPINNRLDIFRLFFLNFFLFNYVYEFSKFFNCFLFICLKQEIKISTVRRGEFKPVSSLIRKRLMRLFFVIIGHNQFCKVVWGRLFESPWKELLVLLFWKLFGSIVLDVRTVKNLESKLDQKPQLRWRLAIPGVDRVPGKWLRRPNNNGCYDDSRQCHIKQ